MKNTLFLNDAKSRKSFEDLKLKKVTDALGVGNLCYYTFLFEIVYIYLLYLFGIITLIDIGKSLSISLAIQS